MTRSWGVAAYCVTFLLTGCSDPVPEKSSASKMPALFSESLGQPDGTSIVFLHGLTGSTRSWGAPSRALSAEHHLLLVDLLGFGRSPKPNLDYSLDQHLLALEKAVRESGIERVHLTGYSTGALLALAYAARYPEHVASLVLIATPWYRNEAEAREHIGRQSLFMRWMAMDTAMAHAACTLMCLARPVLERVMPAIARDVPPRVARDVIKHTWQSYSRSLRHLVIEAQPAEWLQRINAPILFIHGRSDLTAPLSNLKTGIAGRPQTQLEEVDADHHILFTHEQDIANHIMVFLRDKQ